MLQGDFGFSVQNSLPVSTLIANRIMTTVLLGIYAVTFGLLIAVPVAVYQAYRRDRAFDKASSGGSFVLVSVPAIVIAVFLSFLFVVKLGWFPRIGEKVYPWDDLGEHFRNFFLPTLVLVLPLAAVTARILRADMSLTLQSDFISLARAKGMSPRRILWRHALPNSLFSLLTVIGFELGAIIGGAVVAEVYFDLDGMGSLLVVAALGSDLFTVQAIVALLVITVVDRQPDHRPDVLGDRSAHPRGEGAGMSTETFNVAPGDTVEARAVVERATGSATPRRRLAVGRSDARDGLAARPAVPRRVRRPAPVHLRLRADGGGERGAGQPLCPRPGLDRLVRHRRPRQGRLRQGASTGPARRCSSASSRRSSVWSSAG